jgi:hypothetical protein
MSNDFDPPLPDANSPDVVSVNEDMEAHDWEEA